MALSIANCQGYMEKRIVAPEPTERQDTTGNDRLRISNEKTRVGRSLPKRVSMTLRWNHQETKRTRALNGKRETV